MDTTNHKPRTVQVEKRVRNDGSFVFDARWYCPHWTYCEKALVDGRKFCRGHKKGTTGYLTEAEARAAGYRAQEAARLGSRTTTMSSSVTLDEVADEWFSSGPDGISLRTMRGYRDRWRAWNARNGAIGLVPVTAVDAARVDSWMQDLRHTGLARSTMRQDLILLRHILDRAHDFGIIASNPARDVRVPASLQGTPDKRSRLTEGEVWAVADAIEPQYRFAVLLGAYTGLRLGELLGLRASQIDRDVFPHVINVTTQWDESERRFRRPKRTKTRSVPLAPFLAPELQKHLLTYPPSATEHGTVFATRNGTVVSQSNFRKVWNRTLREVGLHHCTPHSLRATFVDIWIDKGVPISDVRDMAGHKDIAVTMNTYKGDATVEKLSNSILAAIAADASQRGDLGQVINGATDIVQVTGVHSDGRIDNITALPTQPLEGPSA